jgi:hypothetical protein
MSKKNMVSRIAIKRKEFILVIFSLITSILFLELGLSFFLRDYKEKMQGKLIDDQIKREITEILVNDAFQRDHYAFILHPYLGFIGNYTKDPLYNKFGFIGPDPIMKKSKEKFIIAIFGGSVAELLYAHSKTTFVNELKRKIPHLLNKKIEVISVGLGGFKQPQQLLALNYFLALGGKFDIVINLDGYNEILLPYEENVQFGVASIFHMNWRFFASKGVNVENVELTANIIKIKKERSFWKEFFSKPLMSKSILSVMLWDFIERRKLAYQFPLERELRDSLLNLKPTHMVSGPFIPLESENDYFIESAKIWGDSSKQMANLSLANNIQFFHFLQPNQYITGSKPLSDEEKKITTAMHNSIPQRVKKGYALLLKEGESLSQEGVNFHELTMIFKNETRTLYTDDCCHFNKLGNDILAKEIARVIAEDFPPEKK